MSHDPRPQRRRDSPRRGAPLKPLRAVLLACGAVVGLFAAGAAAERYSSREPAASTAVAGPAAKATPAKPSTRPPPGIGDAVRDGEFEFVVSRVDCTRASVGPEHLKRTAKGKYCVVSLSVRNIADGSQYFLGHAQKAFDAAGTAYANDDVAGVYANRDTQTFLRKLDRGERVAGMLVFDVPKPVKLTALELHDSPLSGGVRVTLG